MSERMRIARIRRYAIEENEREDREAARARAAEAATPDRKDEDAPVESPVEEWWDE